MKFLMILVLFFSTMTAFADTYVNGYYRKDGTYVQPHYRSNADSNPWNNYSTKGNTNPYTGQQGTVDPCKQNPNAYGCSSTSNW